MKTFHRELIIFILVATMIMLTITPALAGRSVAFGGN